MNKNVKFALYVFCVCGLTVSSILTGWYGHQLHIKHKLERTMKGN